MNSATTNISGKGMNTFIIKVPTGSNSTFLRSLAQNMGWETKVRKARKDGSEMTEEEFYSMIDKAKKQVKDGKVSPVFSNAKDAISYLESL